MCWICNSRRGPLFQICEVYLKCSLIYSSASRYFDNKINYPLRHLHISAVFHTNARRYVTAPRLFPNPYKPLMHLRADLFPGRPSGYLLSLHTHARADVTFRRDQESAYPLTLCFAGDWPRNLPDKAVRVPKNAAASLSCLCHGKVW